MLLIAASRGLQTRLDIAFDVLDDDDCIVDDDADGEHQTEQRKIIECKSEYRHREKRADQRHRDGDDGNDRGAPGLQEQDDHENDEDDRLADRLFDGINRLLDELGRIVDDGVFQARRKVVVASSSIVSMIDLAVVSAFDPGRWKMPIAIAGSRSR